MKNDIARLKRLLFNDSFNIPSAGFEILKGDIIKLLESYFELSESEVKLSVSPDENGNLDINISAKAINVREIKIMD